MRRTIFLAVSIMALMFSCSSAPKAPDGIFDIKNKAADFTQFGNTYYAAGNYEQALRLFKLALTENTKVNNEPGMARSYNSIGKTYIAMGDFETAVFELNKAESLAEELNSAEIFILTKNNMADIYFATKEYKKALDILLEVAEHAQFSPQEDQAVYYHNTAAAYKGLEDYSSAENYANQALVINKELKRFGEAAANYYLLASIYSKQHLNTKAIEYAFKALENDKLYENAPGIGKDLYALGLLYEENDDIQNSYRYFYKAFQVFEALQFERDMIRSLEKLKIHSKSLGMDEEHIIYTQALEKLQK